MLVMVYAPGYGWAGRHPDRFPQPLGLTFLTNDAVWLPVFALYLQAIVRRRGWRALLLGD
jgi:hypothetical protein